VDTRPLCRHCNRKFVNRPRGLCWTCWYTPGVRALYPSTSKFARRGVPDYCGRSPLPSPTAAPPGSPEKVAVLEARAARGQALWHPADSGMGRAMRRCRKPRKKLCVTFRRRQKAGMSQLVRHA